MAFGYCRCLRLCVCVCVCLSVCLSVCPSVCQSLACPRDNSGPVQARIAKFGPKMQKTLVKVPLVLGGNWPWPSRSNLTSKSEFTPFWACPDHYSPPILRHWCVQIIGIMALGLYLFGFKLHYIFIIITYLKGLNLGPSVSSRLNSLNACQVYLVKCVSKSILSVIVYATYGAVVIPIGTKIIPIETNPHHWPHAPME